MPGKDALEKAVARVVLLERLCRGLSILKGEPHPRERDYCFANVRTCVFGPKVKICLNSVVVDE